MKAKAKAAPKAIPKPKRVYKQRGPIHCNPRKPYKKRAPLAPHSEPNPRVMVPADPYLMGIDTYATTVRLVRSDWQRGKPDWRADYLALLAGDASRQHRVNHPATHTVTPKPH